MIVPQYNDANWKNASNHWQFGSDMLSCAMSSTWCSFQLRLAASKG